LGLGGVTSVQNENTSDRFCNCLKLAENGVLGMLTLKTSMLLFSIVDIILGALYIVYLFHEVIWTWEFFNANGPHYVLTAFFYLRITSLPIGIIGFLAVQ
jgi:hypothetical protein